MIEATVLVIDDQRELADLVRRALEREGFEVIIATDGASGLALAKDHRPDLVILDLTMPGVDGLQVCRALRANPRSEALPIIVLSARASVADRSIGLETGADDYVVKPFEPRELTARIRAVLRRAKPRKARVLQVGALTLDLARHAASVRGELIALTAAEFRIVELLIASPERVFSRDEIIEAALGADAAVTARTVDAHVVSIRRKLREEAPMLQTVWGVGYKMEAMK